MKKLKEAINLLAYDSGMWTNEDTPERTEAMLNAVLTKFSSQQVVEMEVFLGTLNEEEFETVCIGEAGECMVLIKQHDAHITNDILEYIFEGDHGL